MKVQENITLPLQEIGIQVNFLKINKVSLLSIKNISTILNFK